MSVPRHWIVGGYTPNPDGATSGTDPDGIGIAAVSGQIYARVEDAKDAAKALAAANPGHIYVVYEAEWWAQVNITPVNLWRVGLTTVG